MIDSINTGSPLGEDFYSFQKEEKETRKKNNSKLKEANKKNTESKDLDVDADDTVDYFKNTGAEPDK